MPNRPAIRHIVFFSAKDKSDVPAIVAGLSELGNIPHSQVFEVRENTQSDALSGEVDVVVYAEFASAADMAAYKAHPIYAEAITVVRPLRELRIAADI
ncbi:Dabb family protein [uncultured Litoreibacter sp.]|uniref:Dabb family protein n=1 Tax=uncultured Litoreibacter sp. TaxID=1392394 RepID=UPI00260B2F38|nr:Dabb family protein [uncultured Litoreibacter sp.]